MKILQFAFDGDPENAFLPHHFPERCVVYTGTHDNDTTVGWFSSADEEERRRLLDYLGVDGSRIAHHLIAAAWSSRARWALAPLQDFLELGTEDRMNLPGTTGGNWQWRFTWEQVPERLAHDILELNRTRTRLRAGL
jgi:4-alpha-glucanotransferase